MSAIRLIADENLNERLVLALVGRLPDLDIVRVRDAGRVGHTDAQVLEWASEQERVVITHDARTMPRPACGRVAAGESMPGVLVVPDDAPARGHRRSRTDHAREHTADDWRDRVVLLPRSA